MSTAVKDEMQRTFIEDFRRAAQAEESILAAWLEGSYGRGNADAFSDVDLHMVLDPAGEERFRTEVEAWLNDLRPLVLYRLLFDGRMINAMTDEALRIDLWLHSAPGKEVDRDRILVLKEEPGALASMPPQEAPPLRSPDRLADTMAEFWRCIAMAPVVIGREERLVGLTGVNIEMGLAVEILCDGYGIVRDAGVKKLNPFLPADLRRALEEALDLQGLTIAELTAAQLRLAALIAHHGPIVAARHGINYPKALEQTALKYIRHCLIDLGLADLLQVGADCGLWSRED